jgi:hypothetical protein
MKTCPHGATVCTGIPLYRSAVEGVRTPLQRTYVIVMAAVLMERSCMMLSRKTNPGGAAG